MARWKRGESEALSAAGELQKLTGAAANGERLLEKATVTLPTARSAIETDPDSAFVLAYDAARQALTALLAHQGLRPTTRGGHYAVEQAARAQFGPGSRQFGARRTPGWLNLVELVLLWDAIKVPQRSCPCPRQGAGDGHGTSVSTATL